MQPMWAKETLRPKRRSASRNYTYSRVPSACGTKLIFRTHGTPPDAQSGTAGPAGRAGGPIGRQDGATFLKMRELDRGVSFSRTYLV